MSAAREDTAARRRGASPDRALAIGLLLATVAIPAAAERAPSGEERSILAPLAPRSLLLDADGAGGVMVVVGERGHVLTSRDDGHTWNQKQVPTRATLTAVFLLDERRGWTVGHDAVILRTTDGGETWKLVHRAPEEERPLLDVRFADAERGLAIGAYGLFMTTDDGGETWASRPFESASLEAADDDGDDREDDFDRHLNQVRRSADGRLYIAAEAGAIYRSDDAGESWVALPAPYHGSFFGTLPLDGGSLLAFGLRGNLYRSDDAGTTWNAIESGTDAMLTNGLRLGDGTVVVSGLAGTLLYSRDGGRSFVLRSRAEREGLSSILEAEDGALVLVGDHGVMRVGAGGS